MISRISELRTEFAELSREELMSVHGGDVVPTEQHSLNFAAIKFEYQPQK
jgi:type VI protein secretion system component Hcp